MMGTNEVRKWFDALEDGHLAVDDGGLRLVGLDINGKPTGAWLEIGGIPLPEDMEPEQGAT